ncbi:coatomer subunit gamma [Savitreella phatthalungensis]
MSSYKKDEEDGGSGGFGAGIDRTSVFQEARIFNQSPVNPRKCRLLLTKIIFLLSQGEVFSPHESTDLFFGMTKLFQHKDPSLRQMVYVVMEELAKHAQDTIMITSSIMKDTATSSQTIYRANSIRALCRIIDAGSLAAIERPLSTAIVDRSPAVSSAAIVSSIHLFGLNKDIVRRWATQTAEAITSKTVGTSVPVPQHMAGMSYPQPTYMTQYHALGLLYMMRSHDRMAIIKLVQQLGNAQLKSPYAVVLLVKCARQVMEEDPQYRAPMMEVILSLLKHKSDMVNIEAAKAVLNAPGVTSDEVGKAISTLQLFLASPRTILRFSAIRMLSKFALRQPALLAPLNSDIEPLVSDSNRSIATYAITTLLKTGSEESVERLMKTIQGFMADISDEFKIIVVQSIRALCLKFPQKQEVTIAFLSSALRDDGGYEFKRAIINAFFDLVRYIKDSKEEALSNLCEFIEDCEFSKLTCRILYMLGLEGPKAKQPSKYVRYIYNRINLENALVRAAAVNALARFAHCPGLTDSVVVLLRRCLSDQDDEVRDRAALNLRILDSKLSDKYIRNDKLFSLATLEKALVSYVQEAKYETAFDVSTIPVVSREESDAAALASKTDIATQETEVIAAPKIETSSTVPQPSTAQVAEQLSAIDEFKPYGQLQRTSKRVALTTPEVEFQVACYVHVYAKNLVLQYDIKNTLPDTILEGISVVAEPIEGPEVLAEDFILAGERAVQGGETVVYVSMTRGSKFALTEVANVLKYTSKEVDPSTGEAEEEGYPDEYEVDTLDITVGTYIAPLYVSDFTKAFEELPESATETYALSDTRSLQDACDKLVSLLSMQPLEGSDAAVNPTTHTLKLAGKATTGDKVLALVQMAFSPKQGVTVKVTARSQDQELAQLVADGVA